MNTLFYIIIASFLISLGALVGIFALALNQEKLSKILLFLVSLSTGIPQIRVICYTWGRITAHEKKRSY